MADEPVIRRSRLWLDGSFRVLRVHTARLWTEDDNITVEGRWCQDCAGHRVPYPRAQGAQHATALSPTRIVGLCPVPQALWPRGEAPAAGIASQRHRQRQAGSRPRPSKAESPRILNRDRHPPAVRALDARGLKAGQRGGRNLRARTRRAWTRTPPTPGEQPEDRGSNCRAHRPVAADPL
jgi:hypothetical protein